MKIAVLRLLAAALPPLCLGTTAFGQWVFEAVVSNNPVPSFPSGLVENAGQWPAEIAFVARYGDNLVRAEAGGLAIQHEVMTEAGERRGSLVHLGLGDGGATNWPSAAGEPLPGVLNFLLGDDPSAFLKGVRRFDGIDFGSVAKGISARLLAEETAPVLRLRVDPGADLESFRIDVEGAASASNVLDDPAAIMLASSIGHLTLRARRFADGLPLGLALGGSSSIRLVQVDQVVEEAVIVDLRLEWSTYIGGSEGEYITSVALDSQERPVFAGWTYSMDFPTTPGSYDTTFNGGAGSLLTDAFLTCMEADGSGLVFSTYFGGGGNDYAYEVAIEGSGDLVIAGYTASATLPTTPGAWDIQHDSFDAFVTRFSADGGSVVASTFLGGSESEFGITGLRIMPKGEIAVTTDTASPDYPVTPNAIDTTASQVDDGAITILDANLSRLVYSTLFGGPWGDDVRGLALRPDGTLAVCGKTFGPDGFPVTPGALDTVPPPLGSAKGFVIVFDPSTGAVVYGTFVPGSPSEIAAHPDGSVTVFGSIASSGKATPGAYDTTYGGGGGDGFLFRLSANGSALHYATYVGGINLENSASLALDSAGRPIVVGMTKSVDFPVTPGAFSTPKTNSSEDAFITLLEADGSRLIYSSRIGGEDHPVMNDAASDIAITSTGAVVVTGGSDGGFPVTPGTWDPNEPATFDSFVLKLTMLPAGAIAYGTATAAGPGTPAPYIGVDAWPSQSDSADFAITCLSAPPDSTQGLLLAGQAALPAGLPLKGGTLWVDPGGLFLLLPVSSDGLGYSRLPLVFPPAPPLAGVVTCWQYLWKPIGVGVPWPMSNALELTVQP